MTIRKMKTKKEINRRISQIFENSEGMFLNDVESARIGELLWIQGCDRNPNEYKKEEIKTYDEKEA